MKKLLLVLAIFLGSTGLASAQDSQTFGTIYFTGGASLTGTSATPVFSSGLTLGGVLTGSGTTATTGEIRIKNNAFIFGRNAANSANRSIVGMDSSDVVTLGDSNTTTQLNGNTINFANHMIPTITDTYDIGNATHLVRQTYIGQINATLFAKSTQTLYGGWLAVSKNAGLLAAAVASSDTTVDFGQSMTTNQFVLIRAMDTGNNATEEYFKVGTLVSGTVYNVTRNLSGVGTKNWAMGTPYQVRGVAGDGWLELNAFDTPRFSIFTQGSLYNNSTENIRIGYLTGMPNSSSGIGAYMGDANNYFRWDGTSLTVKSNSFIFDNTGVRFTNVNSAFATTDAISYPRNYSSGAPGANDIFALYHQRLLTSTDDVVIQNTASPTATNDQRTRVILQSQGWRGGGTNAAVTNPATVTLDSQFASNTSTVSVSADDFSVSSGIKERGRTVYMGEGTSYSPSWGSSGGTTITVGNATSSGQYTRVGKTVYFSFIWTFGSTSNQGAGNFFSWSLPSTAASTTLGAYSCRMVQAGVQWKIGVGYLSSTTALAVLNDGNAGSGIGAGVPFTWTSGSQVICDGWYLE